jgi:undecaprenyl-diphosphatase
MSKKPSQALVALAALLILIFVVFILVLSTQTFLYTSLVSFDHAVDSLLQPLRSNETVAQVMLVATYLGNPEIIIALELCLLAFILVVHRKRIATLFLGGIIVGEVCSLFFKSLLERARPEVIFHVSRHGFSFPSGHALLGMVFYGCLGFFAAHLAKTKTQKIIISSITAIIIFFIGISRIYLGVHWASDVLGGWTLGGACVAAVIAVFFKIHKHTKGDYIRDLTKGEKIGLTAVAFMVGFFVVYYFVTHLGEIRSIV